jgi:hypothetical protein
MPRKRLGWKAVASIVGTDPGVIGTPEIGVSFLAALASSGDLVMHKTKALAESAP